MMIKKPPVLFEHKAECCGCGACVNICPKQAVKMAEDECGFTYPIINEKQCIGCGSCKRVCAFQTTEIKNEPLKTYAAVAKNRDLVEHSASGGVFAALASMVLRRQGVVCGATFSDNWNVFHRFIQNEDQLPAIQGSKYTQSDIRTTYSETKQLLQCGKLVLFSGTPCQIDGLYGFLSGNHDNLLTVDIVCHGVPNQKMFLDWLHSLEVKHNGNVQSFTFRDKSLGWGISGKAVIARGKKTRKITLWQNENAYFYYFSKSWIFRENCYQCKYSCTHRPADITLGDYWGIEKAHPEYLGRNGWDEAKGISLVVANTEKGCEFLKAAEGTLELEPSDFQKAAKGNAQLRHPSYPGKRNEILQAYQSGGWKAVEQHYDKSIGWRRYSSRAKAMVPQRLKRMLKKL